MNVKLLLLSAVLTLSGAAFADNQCTTKCTHTCTRSLPPICRVNCTTSCPIPPPPTGPVTPVRPNPVPQCPNDRWYVDANGKIHCA